MTRAYVVTEGKSDVVILERCLPEDIVKRVTFVPGMGSYAAMSMAATLLPVKKLPVALVLDADTENESAILEREDFLRSFLRAAAGDVPFEVFLAVPTIEAILFRDRTLVPQLTHRELSDQEWEQARYDPKQVLAVASGPLPLRAVMEGLSEERTRVLRQQDPLLSRLTDFLTAVIDAKA